MTEHRPDDHRNDGSSASGRQDALTGWIVFRPKPWHFVGVFGSRDEAELERERAGAGYQVVFGTGNVSSGHFDAAGSNGE